MRVHWPKSRDRSVKGAISPYTLPEPFPSPSVPENIETQKKKARGRFAAEVTRNQGNTAAVRKRLKKEAASTSAVARPIVCRVFFTERYPLRLKTSGRDRSSREPRRKTELRSFRHFEKPESRRLLGARRLAGLAS